MKNKHELPHKLIQPIHFIAIHGIVGATRCKK